MQLVTNRSKRLLRRPSPLTKLAPHFGQSPSPHSKFSVPTLKSVVSAGSSKCSQQESQIGMGSDVVPGRWQMMQITFLMPFHPSVSGKIRLS